MHASFSRCIDGKEIVSTAVVVAATTTAVLTIFSLVLIQVFDCCCELSISTVKDLLLRQITAVLIIGCHHNGILC